MQTTQASIHVRTRGRTQLIAATTRRSSHYVIRTSARFVRKQASTLRQQPRTENQRSSSKRKHPLRDSSPQSSDYKSDALSRVSAQRELRLHSVADAWARDRSHNFFSVAGNTWFTTVAGLAQRQRISLFSFCHGVVRAAMAKMKVCKIHLKIRHRARIRCCNFCPRVKSMTPLRVVFCLSPSLHEDPVFL